MISRLRNEIPDRIKGHFPLASYTTMGVGGSAECFVTPLYLQDISLIQKYRSGEGCPVNVIGGGSNLILLGHFLPGLVISTLAMRQINLEGSFPKKEIVCEAGLPLKSLLRRSISEGLSGLEFAMGIPGTLGGALYGNAGVQGLSVSEVISWVEVVKPGGTLVRLEKKDIEWGYRYSSLGHSGDIIYRCGLSLVPEAPEKIRENCRYWWKKRSLQPYADRSAGCIFKNPEKYSAGWLLEQCGCKGIRKGDAMVSERHANFIINLGHAVSEDVLWLIRECRMRVHEKTGIMLELEVRLIGNENF
ncbi:MAG TPA: UDP-N-acetylmuramate dehydrogenase [Synergistales bacterium]|nr:UDP-N-acetylmuramate dehydrogenase [Synergistales bacterium]